MSEEMDNIEKAFRELDVNLRRGKFAKFELDFIYNMSSRIAQVTKKILDREVKHE